MMRRILLVALVAGLGLVGSTDGPATAQSPTGPTALRVMTYNIQHGAGMDGVFDIDRTAQAIAAARPDVVDLEEVDQNWGDRSDDLAETQVLAARLHMFGYFAQIYDLPPTTSGAPDREFGLAFLSRYPIVTEQNHQITRLSTVATNPAPAQAPGFPEIAIRVRGTLVHVYASHLDYRGESAVRVSQVADMLAFLDEDPTPTVLMGDFNAGPTAPELAPLLAREHDVWALLGRTDPPSWPSDVLTDVNDYITVSNGVRVRDDTVIDTLASDHRPEVADLTLP
jgi:endonuclease/exonuclease/phosphatase family metal-dependent hydrolase